MSKKIRSYNRQVFDIFLSEYVFRPILKPMFKNNKNKFFLRFVSIGSTFGLLFFNHNHQVPELYAFQFSLKRMWMLPRKENNYLGENGSWMCGWLFFYFCKLCEYKDVK